MVIVLAEKSSAARNFAKALGGQSGVFNGEEYKIVHARGHLYKFPENPSELAGESYKNWSWNNMPWNHKDFKWKKVKDSGVSEIVKNIKSALNDADEVAVFTDVDPSGEGGLLAFEVLDALKWKGRTTRAYFADESEKEVQKAFKNRKQIDLKKWDELAKADTRSKFDYLSMQLTRVASLSAASVGRRVTLRQGRLKSVMVYLVGEQLELVNGYVKKPFYTARYQDENGHIYKRKDADEDRYTDISEVSLEPYKPSDVVVDKEEKKFSAPPTLLDLAALSSVLAPMGYKPKTVLSTYQKMYEAQVVSYPRTEDKFMSEEQFNELVPLAEKIAKVVGVDASLLTHKKPRSTHIKSGGAHGANRPGPSVPSCKEEIEDKYGKLGVRIYDILAKSFLALLAEDYVYNHQSGHLKDYPDFKGAANVPVSMGYKAVFDADALDSEEEENALPLGKKAESFIFEGANPKPQNPTQNWLIGKNGKLTKYNVGTGATRTSTLAEITAETKTQLMTLEKGVLGLTELGWTSYKLLNGCQIASPEVTEKLFNDMERVGKFEIKPEEVLVKVAEITAHDMEVMKANAQNITEKVSTTFNGEHIKFNRIWNNRRFTDEEIDLLIAGKEIEFDMSGSTVKGKLEKQEYKGKEFWGFKASEYNNPNAKEKARGIFNGQEVEFNRVWAGHRFTDNEVDRLLDGMTISFEATSKKGNTFTATGKLAKQKYKGREFWGFKAEF